jgi:hypothetical protein
MPHPAIPSARPARAPFFVSSLAAPQGAEIMIVRSEGANGHLCERPDTRSGVRRARC